MKKVDIEFAVIQPLIGNVAIAAENIFGKPPKYIVTYGAPNDKLYTYYRPNVKVITMGADNVPVSEEDKIWFAENKSCNCAIGLPVCAGLSTLTKRMTNSGKKIDATHHNDNMMQIATLVTEIIKPDVYIFENAFQLYTNSGQKIYGELRRHATDTNYKTNIIKTDTQLHGIPQRRHRAFMYFFKNENAVFPWRKKNTLPLGKYMETMSKKVFYNETDHWTKIDQHKSNNVFVGYLEKLHGKDWRKVVEDSNIINLLNYVVWKQDVTKFTDWLALNDTEEKKAFNIRYVNNDKRSLDTKIAKSRESKPYYPVFIPEINKKDYVFAMTGKIIGTLIHYKENRLYTVAERMHLMGFPSDFKFEHRDGGKDATATAELPNQIFNMLYQNVPLCTAEDNIENVLLYLTNACEKSNSVEIKQDNIKQVVDLIRIDTDTHKLF